LGPRAANADSEPIAEVSNYLCERTQHDNLLRRRKIIAVVRKKKQPSRKCAANLLP
jgi:hypothetical protein